MDDTTTPAGRGEPVTGRRGLPALPLPDLRVAALVAAVVLALWPGRVPHGPLVTALTGGVIGAVGWGLASVVVRCVRAAREDDQDAAQRCRSRGRLALAVLAWLTFAAASVEGIALAHAADVRLAHSLGAGAPTLAGHLAGGLGAAFVCAALVTLPRTARAVTRVVRPA